MNKSKGRGENPSKGGEFIMCYFWEVCFIKWGLQLKILIYNNKF